MIRTASPFQWTVMKAVVTEKVSHWKMPVLRKPPPVVSPRCVPYTNSKGSCSTAKKVSRLTKFGTSKSSFSLGDVLYTETFYRLRNSAVKNRVLKQRSCQAKSLTVPQKVKHTEFSTPRYVAKNIDNRDSNRYLYGKAHYSIIHSSHKAETIHRSMNRWTDKQNVVHPSMDYCSILKGMRFGHILQCARTLRTLC